MASVDIAVGEEITFSYLMGPRMGKGRGDTLSFVWDFECSCSACIDPILDRTLHDVQVLDEELVLLVGLGPAFAKRARDSGHRLLSLYPSVCASPLTFGRTYFDLFQVALLADSPFEECRHYISEAIKEMTLFYGDDDHPLLKRIKRFRHASSVMEFIALS